MSGPLPRAGYAALAAALVAAATLGTTPARAVDGDTGRWTEIAWPLAFDPWPAGRAFACPEAVCGAGVRLTVRPKLGLCNCTTGVEDDEEIDRVGDLAALARDWAPASEGRVVAVGTMAGRARSYRLGAASSPATGHAFALVVSKRCDLVTATLYGPSPLPEGAKATALRFLGSEAVAPWAEGSVGGS